MNAVSDITESTAVAIVTASPVVAFTDPAKFDAFYSAIQAEVRAHVPDTSTKKGRDAIASLAYKVARTKTAIDDAGKELNEAARKQINVVDAARRSIREKLDALRDEARKPLDDWEAADAERVAECRRTIEAIRTATFVSAEDTSATVAARLAEMNALVIAEDRFDELAPEAVGLLDTARANLTAAHASLLTQEAERVELERLRAEAAERAERERLAKIEADRIEGERVAAEQAEARRIAAEAAEAERIAYAAAVAAQKARDDAAAEEAAREAGRLAAQREIERKAAEAQAARDRAHAEELARVEAAAAAEVARIKREADEAEAARQAEIARQEREAAEQAAEATRLAAAEERRAANRRHQAAIMGKAKTSLMEHAGLSEELARAVVVAIAGGKIPAVSIQF